MYSVEITVEKDKVTGETRVLSSTTLLPRQLLPQGVKVYEDETKGTNEHPAPALPRPGPKPPTHVLQSQDPNSVGSRRPFGPGPQPLPPTAGLRGRSAPARGTKAAWKPDWVPGPQPGSGGKSGGDSWPRQVADLALPSGAIQ
ncbi:hypothetical protein P7K49_032700 [Saguinus oedipus]|uniref:Paralemmin-1 n=1 Tax=Saguinus oedipus TaxID=9490 RepID=A0ABQ9TPV0_SAGOE|nr:hypothetical protein P7K49_032700 [Saguinus oedipus]